MRDVCLGSFPAVSSMESLVTFDISSNSFTGSLPLTSLPSSLVTFNAALNRFSSCLSLSNIPPYLVMLNLSSNGFEGASVTLTNLTLNLDTSEGLRTVVLDITSNDFICPFPGVGDITGANPGASLVIFKDNCRTDISPYILPSIVVLVVAIVLVSIAGAVKPLRDKISALYSRMIVIMFVFGYFPSSQVGRVIDILSYNSMYHVATFKSPDNCLPVNNEGIYRPVVMPFTNSDLNGTAFPDWSCEDPTLGLEPNCVMVHNDIANFTVYINYVLHGWPNQQYPVSVQSSISSFQKMCNGFVKVNEIEECQYNPVSYACERVQDGALPLNLQFLSFMYISIALVAVSTFT